MPSYYSPTYYEDRKRNLGNQGRIAEEQRHRQRQSLRKVPIEAPRHDDNYLNGLEPKLVRLLSLVHDYKIASKEYSRAIRDIQRQKHRALIKKNEKLDEDNKRLGHMLESCHRLRTQTEKEEKEPPIDLGNGKALVSIEDPAVW